MGAPTVLAAVVLIASSCGGESSIAGTSDYPTTNPAPETSVAVATTFVPDPSSTTTSFVPAVCTFGAEELDVSDTAESTAVESNADHVSGVAVKRSPGCGRVVIDLGTEFSYDIPGPAANTVPAGTSVSVVDSTLRVQLADTPNVSFSEVDPDVGDDAILARMPGSSRQLEVVVFPNGEFTAFSAEFLDNPARVIVDFSEQPLMTAATVVPLLFGDVIIESISANTTGSADALPGTVFSGFARPFEAQLEVMIEDQSGNPIAVTCGTGCYITDQPTEQLGVPTTDWVDAWGEFEFTVTDLQSGLYTIRLSSDAGAVESATWVEMPFVIGQ